MDVISFRRTWGLPAHLRPASPPKIQISCPGEELASKVIICADFNAFWNVDPVLSFSEALGIGFGLLRKPRTPQKHIVFLCFSTKIIKQKLKFPKVSH